MAKVGDRLWIWGHEAGSHNKLPGLPGTSRMTPSEAAQYMGIPNVIMVTYGGQPEPPFDRAADALASCEQVVWSIVGDSSSKRNDKVPDLDEVIRLAETHSNITGAIMDDLFHAPDDLGAIARFSVQEVANFRSRLHAAKRPLDLWAVLYDHDLRLPAEKHLAECDIISFWTWKAQALTDMEQNFARIEMMAPATRKVLGCYLWDYGAEKTMPLDLMRRQCNLGLKWLRQGRIEGMIFLASCICDLGLEAVEWTRQWIRDVEQHPL